MLAGQQNWGMELFLDQGRGGGRIFRVTLKGMLNFFVFERG